MSEYVPTTEQVRGDYAMRKFNDFIAANREPAPALEIVAEFDRWLADHDRQVRAEALREAASILPEATEGIDRVGTSDWAARDRDIYSLAIEEAAEALLFRADRIESQETP